MFSRFLAVLSFVLISMPAQAAVFAFHSTLTPEAPGATGTGTATLSLDNVLHTLFIDLAFAGLSGTTTVAHIHAPAATPFTGTAGVAVTPGTLPGFPAGVTAGIYSVTLDLTDFATYTSGFLILASSSTAIAEQILLDSFRSGRAYVNIHTTTYPGGEIRGFPTPVPLPAGMLLMLTGLAALALPRRGKT